MRGGERFTRMEGVVGSGSEKQLGPDEASPNAIQPDKNYTMPPHRTAQTHYRKFLLLGQGR